MQEAPAVRTLPIQGNMLSRLILLRTSILMIAAAAASALAAQVQYPTGDYPKFIITVDLNNDGKKDLVTANYHAATISVLINTGSGFAKNVDYNVGPYPTGISAGDFNGDGKTDLVVADAINPHSSSCSSNCPPQPQAIAVLLGNGDGTFKPATFITAPSGTDWVSAGDVNGDGKVDIEAADWQVGEVTVLLSNGDGTFQPARNFKVGAVPHSIALGDYNRDGKVDMVVGNMYSDNIQFLAGDGTGNFTPGGTYMTGDVPHAITHNDFNGDHLLDVASANINSNNISVFLGNGDGTFQPATNYASGPGTCNLVSIDINGDGIPDIVAANSNVVSPGVVGAEADPESSSSPSSTSIFFGLKGGGFQLPAVQYMTGDGSNGVAVADFNRDGFMDIAVEHFADYVSVLWGIGNGQFSTTLPTKGSSK